MALPNNDQYIRGMALESAVQATQVLLNPNADYGVWDKESILALADEFAEYIEGRRKF
jgi:hypothetical protein